MIENKLKPLSIIFIGFILTGCSSISDESSVDQAYLHSQKYQQYKNNILKERKHRAQQKVSFKKLVSKLAFGLVNHLEENESIPWLTAPVVITNERIVAMLEERVGWEPFARQTKSVYRPDYAYSVVGKYSFDNGMLLFFLLKEGALYRHGILLLATAQKDILTETRAIASYRKNLTSQIITEVNINSMGIITVVMKKSLFYPIVEADKYKHIYTKRYKITTNGRILDISKQ